MNNRMLSDLSKNNRRIDKYMEQLTTNRVINRLSDDPVGLTYSMRFRSELNYNDQYQRSTESALSWTDYTDTMMGQANDVMQRVRELTVQGSNGVYAQTELDIIATEIEQNYEKLVEIGNAQLAGKYIFSGQNINSKPYSIATAATDVVDKGGIPFQIGPGIEVNANLNGEEVFGTAGSIDNAFNTVQNIVSALRSGDQALVSAGLGKIDQFLEVFQEKRAVIGAKQNRLDLAKERLTQENIKIQEYISKAEDAEIPAVITNLKTAEAVYQATLSAGARIIRPSLADFLR